MFLLRKGNITCGRRNLLSADLQNSVLPQKDVLLLLQKDLSTVERLENFVKRAVLSFAKDDKPDPFKKVFEAVEKMNKGSKEEGAPYIR